MLRKNVTNVRKIFALPRNKSPSGAFILIVMETSRPDAVADQRVGAWLRDHGPAVRGYLYALLRRHDLADDLAQEVFCRAWESHSRYEEQGHARAFLLRIADRLACDQARRGGREATLHPDVWREMQLVDQERRPDERAADGEAARRLHTALDEITPIQRRVLLLRFYGQMTFQEIADAVDCPLGTVLSHCQRGLESLRKRLAE